MMNTTLAVAQPHLVALVVLLAKTAKTVAVARDLSAVTVVVQHSPVHFQRLMFLMATLLLQSNMQIGENWEASCSQKTAKVRIMPIRN